MPDVNPEILVWARETAGLSLEAAAKAINLSDTKEKTGAEKLAALESGEVEPSRSLLLKMANRYRRSLLVFYLDAPPPRGDRGQDFRTLPHNPSTTESALLDALIRDLQTRQSLVKSLLEDEDDHKLPYIGSVQIDIGVKKLAERIQSTISFDLTRFRRAKKIEDAFNYLRSQIESIGIFVLLASDLGSHHTAIPVDIFRGFAIADPIAPFVVINSLDARSAQSFTALHETVHLWLGSTGVSGKFANSRLEKFCNDVAGEILLPSDELENIRHVADIPFNEATSVIADFATSRKISRSMVAYKLHRMKLVDEDQWEALNSFFDQEWRDAKKQEKLEKDVSSSGPSYYITQGYRVGQALLNVVSRAISEGTLTPTKAGKVLGVKPRNVDPLLKTSMRQGGR